MRVGEFKGAVCVSACFLKCDTGGLVFNKSQIRTGHYVHRLVTLVLLELNLTVKELDVHVLKSRCVDVRCGLV